MTHRRARRDGGRDRGQGARRDVAGARRRRALPRSHRPPRRRARLLPAGRRGRARGGAPTPSMPRARRGAIRARWPACRSAQGHLLHARASRPPAPRRSSRLRAALRRDRGRAPGGRGRRDPRQAQHGRVRDGLVEREQLGQAGAQPVGLARVPGGSSGGSAAAVAAALCAGRSAPTPAARSASPPRSAASSASSRPTAACRATASSRSRRRSIRSGPFARTVDDAARAARGDRRPRSARLDRSRSRSARYREAARAGRAARRRSRACAWASPRVLRARHGPRGRGGRARRARRAGARRRDAGATSRCRTRSTRSPTYYLSHRRGVVEPGALRRRPLRPPRGEARRRSTTLREDARRGLRRRGEAPHHARHLRAARRLLRRLLPQGAAGAHAHPARLHRGVQRGATRSSRRPSPTPAFKLGEKMDDPLEMYLADVFTLPCNLAGLPGDVSCRAASRRPGCRSACSSSARRSTRRRCFRVARRLRARAPTGTRAGRRSDRA